MLLPTGTAFPFGMTVHQFPLWSYASQLFEPTGKTMPLARLSELLQVSPSRKVKADRSASTPRLGNVQGDGAQVLALPLSSRPREAILSAKAHLHGLELEGSAAPRPEGLLTGQFRFYRQSAVHVITRNG